MDPHGTSGLKGMNGEGQKFALLCPSLQNLQIEGQNPSAEPELIPLLKDIVIRRAELGSPFKDFTFSVFLSEQFKPGSLFKLAWTNGSFTMKKRVLPEGTKKFKLDI